MRSGDIAKRLMFRVGQIDGPSFFGGEGEREAMRKSLVKAFRAVVGAPFEPFDLRDLGRQGGKGLNNLIDFCLRGGFFEFE